MPRGISLLTDAWYAGLAAASSELLNIIIFGRWRMTNIVVATPCTELAALRHG